MTTDKATEVRCRFAPSPTGYLHVGGARTALFNYLFAKRMNGTFILRIEDTDLERNSEEATTAILQSMEWLHLTPDEGPFYQSQRFELYRQFAQQLLASGHAYRCTCTSAELEQMREEQRTRGEKPRYDRRHRPSAITPQPTELPTGKEQTPFVIRLATPIDGNTVFDDAVVGQVCTANEELDDFIILRSDGTPTYNFVVVVDDIDMRITHVIRGSDHISNTPKQVVIYQALGSPLPVFAHVPMILGADKKKLSKRHGAVSVYEYRKDGYLPDGFINYLARLGWSHGDQELFTRADLEEVFTLEHIGKSPSVFDVEKLLWVNAEHIKICDEAMLLDSLIEFIPQAYFDAVGGQEALRNDSSFRHLVRELRERSKTLPELVAQCAWLFDDAPLATAEPKLVQKQLHTDARVPLQKFYDKVTALGALTHDAVETAFNEVLAECSLGFGKLGQPLRIALSGLPGGVGLFAIMEILGKERTLKRIEAALLHIQNIPPA